MARKPQTPPSEDPPPVGDWIVTFSDCMTLLLCFFVLMVTFSSFDDVAQNKISGAFNIPTLGAVSDSISTARDSIIAAPERQVYRTRGGSEQPTESPMKNISNPKPSPPFFASDAHRDKQVFYIRSRRLFWGNGHNFNPSGEQMLGTIAHFVKLMPCHVIIGEIPGRDESALGRGELAQRGAARSWSIVRYFTTADELPLERFHISASQGVAPDRFGGEAVIEITLLLQKVFR